MKIFEIIFYQTSDGHCEFWDYLGDAFLLLHHFRKSSQKTPKMEILKAHKEIADYSKRKDIQI
ncbi:MAG: type II toxin-antitoxin system RelE/ParE family toxin [Erysipelotrichaceae bacterium]|nr:type II toxin-antitoxin system RelE/ParE family toxin [Erysipelotrichaceae bacterium]